jgi:hypothetical protein
MTSTLPLVNSFSSLLVVIMDYGYHHLRVVLASFGVNLGADGYMFAVSFRKSRCQCFYSTAVTCNPLEVTVWVPVTIKTRTQAGCSTVPNNDCISQCIWIQHRCWLAFDSTHSERHTWFLKQAWGGFKFVETGGEESLSIFTDPFNNPTPSSRHLLVALPVLTI